MSGRTAGNQHWGALDSSAPQGDRLLSSAFHHSPIPMCILSLSGALIAANRALCDVLLLHRHHYNDHVVSGIRAARDVQAVALLQGAAA